MVKCNKQQFWNSLTDEEKQIMREGKKIFDWEWCPYEYEDTGEIIRDGKVIAKLAREK